jgi:hypothetical protein
MTREVPRNAAPEPGHHVEEVWSKRHVRLLRVPEPTTRSRVLAMVPSDDPPSPLALARLSNHAAICRRLDGVPHVVQLLAAQPRPGTSAVLMAHADGRPLSDWVRDVAGTPDGRLPDLVAWLRAMHAPAAALEGVHAAGIVLKSLAPQRVLCDPVHGAVLTDFGLATRMPRELQEALPAGAIEQTLAHMAPEPSGRLARGIDARSDLDALGCIGHELLTAGPPFAADDPQARGRRRRHAARLRASAPTTASPTGNAARRAYEGQQHAEREADAAALGANLRLLRIDAASNSTRFAPKRALVEGWQLRAQGRRHPPSRSQRSAGAMRAVTSATRWPKARAVARSPATISSVDASDGVVVISPDDEPT